MVFASVSQSQAKLHEPVEQVLCPYVPPTESRLIGPHRCPRLGRLDQHVSGGSEMEGSSHCGCVELEPGSSVLCVSTYVSTSTSLLNTRVSYLLQGQQGHCLLLRLNTALLCAASQRLTQLEWCCMANQLRNVFISVCYNKIICIDGTEYLICYLVKMAIS